MKLKENENIKTNKKIHFERFKKDFARVAKENNIVRVQTAIRKDFVQGQRFAEWLGLENEGLMRKFGFDGTDQYRYARIF